jgi:aquaporin Z
MKKYIAELVGTCVLTLGVALSIEYSWPVPTVLVAGIIVAIAVYLIGPISGSHLNPAITVAAFVLKRIKKREAIYYMFSQLIGALIAMVVAKTYVGVSDISASLFFIADSSNPVIIGELVGTFIFALLGSAIVVGQIPRLFSGIAMSFALMIGILAAFGLGSLGVLNPAVAIGLGFFNIIYILVPLVGGALGAYCYRSLMPAAIDMVPNTASAVK